MPRHLIEFPARGHNITLLEQAVRQQVGGAPSCGSGLLTERMQLGQHAVTPPAAHLRDHHGKLQRRKDRCGT